MSAEDEGGADDGGRDAVAIPYGQYDELALCRIYDCPGCGLAVIMRGGGHVSHESPVCEEFHDVIRTILGREPTYLEPSLVEVVDPLAPEGDA